MTNHQGSEPYLLLTISALGAMAVTWSMYYLWVGDLPFWEDDTNRPNKFQSSQAAAAAATTMREDASYFPWEGVGTRRVNVDTRQERSRTTDDSAERRMQLEFLSSMTFASGGIRAPNCVCCV